MGDTTEEEKPRFLLKAILWAKQAGWPIAVLLVVLQARGCISQEFADKIKDTLKPSPTPVVNLQETVEPVKAMTPTEWAELLKTLVDLIKKPDPLPNPPKPLPEPPKPQPDSVVKPDPPKPPTGLLEILVSDESGKVIPSSTVEAGQLFRVSALGNVGEIGWQPVKHGAVKLSASTDGTEYTGYLEAGQWVDFGLTDFGSKKQLSMRISCNQGAQPPPIIQPDDDKVVIPPPPQTFTKLSLAVRYDATKIDPDTAIVLNATPTWNSFITSGHEWKFYEAADDTIAALKVAEDAGSVKVPTLVICNRDTKSKIVALPLPMTTEDLVSVVKKYSGG